MEAGFIPAFTISQEAVTGNGRKADSRSTVLEIYTARLTRAVCRIAVRVAGLFMR